MNLATFKMIRTRIFILSVDDTGQNYYYNLKSKESTWERPRSAKQITLHEDAADPEKSSTGIGNGALSDKPSSSTSSRPDENADMKAIVAIEEEGRLIS